MPVQINEMVITVDVESNNRQTAVAAASTATPAENQSKKLIEACLEQVLDVIRNKNER